MNIKFKIISHRDNFQAVLMNKSFIILKLTSLVIKITFKACLINWTNNG